MKGRTLARWVLAAAYLVAGTLHVTHPGPFLRITPHWVPFPHEIVVATGICELFGAVGLLIPRTRWWAGVMLALYALCVWPANMQHAILDLGSGTGLGWSYHAPRLLLQPAIIWWALFAGGVTSWPFTKRH
ncbi:DoxX family protein [Sphingomonas sp. BIUV-7]|uniref:DoxX family protein n=1 Tax=Sphingomonas natans TaxID=3063330 RepID=A0ABT8YBC9_9SPHN|nr:DoxX family protein [Sphingomonas sp. BIUV-7]MDO6415630.1 DoxX family protein [Sphingomonas sp. BIUV-7]